MRICFQERIIFGRGPAFRLLRRFSTLSFVSGKIALTFVVHSANLKSPLATTVQTSHGGMSQLLF